MTRTANNLSIATVSPSAGTDNSPFNFAKSSDLLMLTGAVIFLIVLAIYSNDGKGKLSFGYMGGGKEKLLARKEALKDISPFLLDEESAKLTDAKRAKLPKARRDSCSLWLNTPPDTRKYWNQQFGKKQKSFKAYQVYKDSTLYMPGVQRGTAVSGASGAGKTVSAIDRMIHSALDQGFPTVIYDFKSGAQSSRHVANAIRRGYKVRIFAPGMPESDTVNMLDFIKDEADAVAAGQISRTIIKNANSGSGGSTDGFFDKAGMALIEGILLLTKWVAKITKRPDYADLMMAQALLNLPNLGNRIAFAIDRIPSWTYQPLAQIVSVKDAAETISGIVATAQAVFQQFLKRDFIGAFCGKSTLPLDIDGKTLVVFILDRNNRDVVSPLLAAVMDMIISRNVSRLIPRLDPLCVFLDELPTIYLPRLSDWLAQNREDGFCGVLGFQNFTQLVDRYGKEMATAIFSCCATKMLFNPGELDSAEMFAKMLGEEDIAYKSKSKSSGGGSGGGSTSTSDNLQKRWLMEASRWLKMPPRQAVILSPGYSRGDEAYVPIYQKFKLIPSDMEETAWAVKTWKETIQPAMIAAKSNRTTPEVLSEQMRERMEMAFELFPEPPPPEKEGKGGSKQRERDIPVEGPNW
jgi:type IV secretory pathway TraG/TraD family ATPase VirD4